MSTLKEGKGPLVSTKRSGAMQHRLRFATKKPTTVLPPIKLPFPPTINPQRLVDKISTKRVLARFPNSFIIYRNEYVQYLKSQGYHLSMTELSPMISRSWKVEPEFVKDTYTRISLQAEKLYLRRSTEKQLNTFTSLDHAFQPVGVGYLNSLEYALFAQQDLYNNTASRQNPHRRTSVQQENQNILPSPAPLVGDTSANFSPGDLCLSDNSIEQMFGCSASTSPTMELPKEFFSAHPLGMKTAFNQPSAESTNFTSMPNVSSLFPFDIITTSQTTAESIQQPEGAPTDDDLVNQNPLPFSSEPGFYGHACPLDLVFENETWNSSSSNSTHEPRQLQQHLTTAAGSEDSKFEVCENSLNFDGYDAVLFNELNNGSSGAKLSNFPIEVFENYNSGHFTADVSTLVSS